MANTRPFSGFEFMIAWRYLRARRAEGGVSVMTWISLIGITLGVMALVATLAVRAGFRADFVDSVVGANAHSTVYYPPSSITNELTDEIYTVPGVIENYQGMSAQIAAIAGVTQAVPTVKGQVMASAGDRANVAEVFGVSLDDLRSMTRIINPDTGHGDIDAMQGEGIAIGMGIARELGVGIGDKVTLTSPNGAKTAFGTTPRINSYTVAYVFSAGRYDIDRTRIYLPLAEAQSFFNREGMVDEIQVFVSDVERVDDWTPALMGVAGQGAMIWTWQDAWGEMLRSLKVEDDVMFIILSILVLIASMNITSGLIMLVKNKGRDIGILRTMGLTEGAILRVFFLCGAFTGIVGTIAGVLLGIALSLNVSHIMAFVNWLSDGGAWEPSVRGIYQLNAKLQVVDIAKAVGLSLFLSFVVTIFPARRAARMNPVEALRYE